MVKTTRKIKHGYLGTWYFGIQNAEDFLSGFLGPGPNTYMLHCTY